MWGLCLFVISRSNIIAVVVYAFYQNIFAGVLLSLSAPIVYDKYQDHIDEKLCVTHRYAQMQYRKLDENVLRKIPLPLNKEKKMQ